MKKHSFIAAALGSVICLAATLLMTPLFPRAVESGPWKEETINVTADIDNFVVPPVIPGWTTLVPEADCYRLSGGVYTAAVGATAAEPQPQPLMQTNAAKVPLVFGPDLQYTVSFDYTLNEGSGLALRSYVEGKPNQGAFFNRDLTEASGTFSETIDFSSNHEGAWVMPSDGDVIFLCLAATNTQGIEIRNFQITRIYTPDPWADDEIDVTADIDNFVVPPYQYNWIQATFREDCYTLSDGIYKADAGEVIAGDSALLRTDAAKVPLVFGPGQKYKISFDYSLNGGSGLGLRGYVEGKDQGAFFHRDLTAPSGTFSEIIDFSSSHQGAWVMPSDGDIIFLCMSAANTQGVAISNFTISKVAPPDPWAEGEIDMTADDGNFVIPPSLTGIAHGQLADYALADGVYKAEADGTEEGAWFALMQTNTQAVPMTFGENVRYTITFDYTVTGTPGDFGVRGYVEGLGVSGVYIQEGLNAAGGTYNQTFDFAVSQGQYMPTAGDLITLGIFSQNACTLKISHFSITRTEYKPPLDDNQIDVLADAGNLVFPPHLVDLANAQYATARYTLADGVYKAEPDGTEEGAYFSLMQTNAQALQMAYGANVEYTISFDYKVTGNPGDFGFRGYLENVPGVNGVYIERTLVTTGGNFTQTFDFGETQGKCTPNVGDLVTLGIFAQNACTLEISNFIITKTTYEAASPWKNGKIDVTADIRNFDVPSALPGIANAYFENGSYSLADGVYHVTPEVASGEAWFGLMKTDAKRVPLVYNPGETYTISFDYEMTGNPGIFGLVAFVEGAEPAVRYIDREWTEASGTFQETFDFGATHGGATPEPGDIISLGIYSQNAVEFTLRNFIIKNKDYIENPWVDGKIDVTGDAGNFVIPPYLNGIAHAQFDKANYTIEDGVYVADPQGAQGAYFALMQTDTDRVPLICDPEKAYVITFDWELIGEPSGDFGLNAYVENGNNRLLETPLQGRFGSFYSVFTPYMSPKASENNGKLITLGIYSQNPLGIRITNFKIEEGAPDINSEFSDPWGFYDPWSNWDDWMPNQKPSQSVVYGYLRDKSGNALAGNTLVLKSGSEEYTAVSEEDGYFEIIGVAADTYDFYLLHNDELIWSGLEVQVGEQELIKIQAVFDGKVIEAQVVFDSDPQEPIPGTGYAHNLVCYGLTVCSAAALAVLLRKKRAEHIS